MKTITLIIVMLCGTVYGQTAYRFCNPQYGVKDPREWMPESLYTNCVLWMPMNNDPTKLSSWGVPDGSWSRNNGIQTNADNRPVWTNAANGSLMFDGSNDFTDMGNALNPIFTGTSAKFTICAWFFNEPVAGSVIRSIVSKYNPTANQRAFTIQEVSGTTAGNRQYIYAIAFESPNISGDRLEVGSIADSISSNAWNHIAMVFDFTQASQTNRIKGYYNGVLREHAVVVGTGCNGIESTTTPVLIGANANNAFPFKNIIDDVPIFNRALTATEILYLYNTTKGRHGIP